MRNSSSNRGPPPPDHTGWPRTGWATPRRGRRPPDGYRQEPPGQTQSRYRRRNSTWKGVKCTDFSCEVKEFKMSTNIVYKWVWSFYSPWILLLTSCVHFRVDSLWAIDDTTTLNSLGVLLSTNCKICWKFQSVWYSTAAVTHLRYSVILPVSSVRG